MYNTGNNDDDNEYSAQNYEYLLFEELFRVTNFNDPNDIDSFQFELSHPFGTDIYPIWQLKMVEIGLKQIESATLSRNPLW